MRPNPLGYRSKWFTFLNRNRNRRRCQLLKMLIIISFGSAAITTATTTAMRVCDKRLDGKQPTTETLWLGAKLHEGKFNLGISSIAVPHAGGFSMLGMTLAVRRRSGVFWRTLSEPSERRISRGCYQVRMRNEVGKFMCLFMSMLPSWKLLRLERDILQLKRGLSWSFFPFLFFFCKAGWWQWHVVTVFYDPSRTSSASSCSSLLTERLVIWEPASRRLPIYGFGLLDPKCLSWGFFYWPLLISGWRAYSKSACD